MGNEQNNFTNPAMKGTTRRYMLQMVGGACSGAGLAYLGVENTEARDEGSELWRHDPDSGVFSPATVVDGAVYFGTGQSVVSVDATTGSEQWTFAPDVDGTGATAIEEPPTVVDDVVFVVNNSQQLYALDAESSDVFWSEEIPTSSGPSTQFTVRDGTIFITEEGVTALDAATGSHKWRTELDALGVQSVVADGTVYFSEVGGPMYALDAETGEQRWQFPDDDEFVGLPTVVDDTVFAAGDVVYALDSATGDVLWEYDLDDDTPEYLTSADETVLVSVSGTLHAVAENDGSLRWSRDIEFTGSALTVVDDTVFVAGMVPNGVEHSLSALDLGNGDIRSQTEIDPLGPPLSLIASGGKLFAHTSSEIHAFEAGVDGASDDSRIRLASDGHHDSWTSGQDLEMEIPADDDESGETEESDTEERDVDEQDGDGDDELGDEEEFEEVEDEEPAAAEEGPGFGVGVALAGMGAGYLLKRKLTDSEGYE